MRVKLIRVLIVLLGLLAVFVRGHANDVEDSILVIAGPSTTIVFSYDLRIDSIDQIAPHSSQINQLNNIDSVDRSYEGEYISFVEIDGTESRLFIQNIKDNTLENFEEFRVAAWSPTMNKFVTSNRDNDIVIYDIDEAIITHTWNFVGNQGTFTWSPDSMFLAFYSSVDIETGEEPEQLFEKFIYIMDIQSGDTTLVADWSDACGPYSDYRYLEWSPDGERLALSAQCAVSLNAPIFAIELNGFLTNDNWTADAIEMRQLTVADNTRHGIAGLAWSLTVKHSC